MQPDTHRPTDRPTDSPVKALLACIASIASWLAVAAECEAVECARARQSGRRVRADGHG